ncbi:cytochrome b-c1 complex subunit 6, mitochondrial-like isoform X2 [Anneissia japonica]|uniref:cytochrome b-c1 complex subunit 6, mitochondrial-like isoform X1 n=1 Tax=Anneissia japonica TaxID=1529436 RepID=UPI001425AA32|nr:cytochrome b-c1 complex subunit 6, mitochondrial-like isoform X1 [Anneissia japonica]XP_033096786.1 cytochrome b-c1 complex subunit 6, mitochondrial-like isoform X2 [Anneissia japonica]
MAGDEERRLEGDPPEDEEEEEEEEEDLIDPADAIRESCQDLAESQALKAELDECTARVQSRSNTEETCTQELFDFLHCVDHCVSQKIFSHLK